MKITCRLGWHEWLPTTHIQGVFDESVKSDKPIYQRQIFKCRDCGRLRSRRI